MASRIALGPSILTANLLELGAQIGEAVAAGVDYIHLDVMDGRFVPNISFGLPVCAALRRATALPIDAHLMITHPENYIDAFADAGADRITVHQEVSPHLHRTLMAIRERGLIAGVAVNPATPIAAIEEVLPFCGQVLVMLVNPGFGGQSLIPEMLGKVRRLRTLLDAQNPGCLLQVDGGIKPDNLADVVKAGADTVVVGSAIYSDRVSVAESVSALRAVLS